MPAIWSYTVNCTLLGHGSPDKSQAFGQVVETSSLAQLTQKWYLILTLGWIQDIQNAIQALHAVFLMFEYVWDSGTLALCVESIVDDAPIEGGDALLPDWIVLDWTVLYSDSLW